MTFPLSPVGTCSLNLLEHAFYVVYQAVMWCLCGRIYSWTHVLNTVTVNDTLFIAQTYPYKDVFARIFPLLLGEQHNMGNLSDVRERLGSLPLTIVDNVCQQYFYKFPVWMFSEKNSPIRLLYKCNVNYSLPVYLVVHVFAMVCIRSARTVNDEP